MSLDVLQRRNKDNSFGTIASRRIQDRVHILTPVVLSRTLIRIFLSRSLQSRILEKVLNLVGAPINFLAQCPIILGMVSLAPQGLRIYCGNEIVVRPDNGKQLLLVGSEDILFATAEIGMDLAGQESILRYVCLSGVLVQRQQQHPGYSAEHEKQGEVWR